jgi:hypothetical protein
MALREICKRDSVHIQYWRKDREGQEKAAKEEDGDADVDVDVEM